MKFPKLIVAIVDGSDGAKTSFCDRGATGNFGHGKYLLLDFRSETKHTHDLSHPGSGDALLASNLGLAGDLSGFQDSLSLDGISEEFYHSGDFRFQGRFGVAPTRQNKT